MNLLKRIVSNVMNNDNQTNMEPVNHAPAQPVQIPTGYVEGVNYFKSTHATFKEKLKRNGEVTIEWDLIDGVRAEDIIDDITGSCGCTASFSWGGSKVKAVFTNQESNIPKEGVAVKKTIYVKYRDGKHKISNGRGGMKWPEVKASQQLSFSGTVIR